MFACVLSTHCASALHPVDAHVASSGPALDADGYYTRIRALLRDVEAEHSGARRETLAEQAVALGQRCDLTAHGNPLCDYGLALALGVQARERPATAHDGLPLMVQRLKRAAVADPKLDHAGPERVLGLVLVRAPGWPSGPGDPESGLESARRAAARDPDYAPNWLAVAEAADATGDAGARRQAAHTADGLAANAVKAGESDAAVWQRDADKFLAK